MPQSDVAVDAIVRRGLADIIRDGGSTRTRLVRMPWPERKPESVHIRIGTDPWIAEQIPRSTDCIARLENRVGLSGKGSLQPVSSVDAGYSRANDQYVEMFLGLHQHVCVVLVSGAPVEYLSNSRAGANFSRVPRGSN